MRLLSRAAVVLAAIVFAAPALHAQTSFSIAAGASLPMGDLSDGVEMGYNATLGIGFKPPVSPIGLRVEGMFNSFGAKVGDGSLRVLGLTANGTYTIMPQAYLIGGVGMYNSKVEGVDETENDFGFNIGAGINIPLTGFGTYIEARYHHIPVEGGSSQFLPISVGIRF